MATPDQRPLFARQPGESARAFAAFRTYLDMGDGRSLAKLGRKWGKHRTTIEQWSVKWRWQERLNAKIEHDTMVEQEARDAKLRAKADEWARREQALREDRWNLAQRILARIDKMLQFPVARSTTKGGKTIVMPSKWTDSSIAQLTGAADKLAALAVGAPTEHAQVTGKDGGPVVPASTAGTVVIYLPKEDEKPT